MLKEKISRNEAVFGTWCEIPTPYSINIIASAGMDFVILDMEHGVMEYELIQNMVFAAHCEDCGVIVRVPDISEAYILRALDTGADGIIIPHVECLQDIQRVVKFSKYPPKGEKGFNPYTKAGGYTKVKKDFFEKHNSNLLIGAILEGKQAFQEIEEIVSEEDIDILYIGQYDLSVALGIPGDVNNSLVTDMLEKAINVAERNHKYTGCMVHGAKEAQDMIKLGVKFVVYKVDSGVLFDAYKGFRNEVE